jgi:hypothetical protein
LETTTALSSRSAISPAITPRVIFSQRGTGYI